MIWSVDTEDFRGLCGTKFPLLTAINKALGKVSQLLLLGIISLQFEKYSFIILFPKI